MKKRLSIFSLLIIFVWSGVEAYAQKKGQALIDSLLAELPKQKEDTLKVTLLCDIINYYYKAKPAEVDKYAKQARQSAEGLKWKKGIARTYIATGLGYFEKKNYHEALKWYLAALKGVRR